MCEQVESDVSAWKCGMETVLRRGWEWHYEIPMYVYEKFACYHTRLACIWTSDL